MILCPSLTLTKGKQPGHESNQCPLPRTTEAKQCYHCQGLGHVQADCPTLRLTGAGSNRCYNCNQPGHLAVSQNTRQNFSHHVDIDPSVIARARGPLVLAVALLSAAVDSRVALAAVDSKRVALLLATSAVDPTILLVTAKRRP